MSHTEHFYNIEFEGLCVNERDLEKLLELLAVAHDAEINMNLETSNGHKLGGMISDAWGSKLREEDGSNILKQIDICKISYDGSGTYLGGE
tara:strand:+ start:326 stop:598 length:273 start_codon:yes stop_codon:yes gene_type:complete